MRPFPGPDRPLDGLPDLKRTRLPPDAFIMLAALRSMREQSSPGPPPGDEIPGSHVNAAARRKHRIGSLLLRVLPRDIREDIRETAPTILAARDQYREARIKYPRYPSIANMYAGRAAREIEAISYRAIDRRLAAASEIEHALRRLRMDIRHSMPTLEIEPAWRPAAAAATVGRRITQQARQETERWKALADDAADHILAITNPSIQLAIATRAPVPKVPELPTHHATVRQELPAPSGRSPAKPTTQVMASGPQRITRDGGQAQPPRTSRHDTPWLLKPIPSPYPLPGSQEALAMSRRQRLAYTWRRSRAHAVVEDVVLTPVLWTVIIVDSSLHMGAWASTATAKKLAGGARATARVFSRFIFGPPQPPLQPSRASGPLHISPSGAVHGPKPYVRPARTGVRAAAQQYPTTERRTYTQRPRAASSNTSGSKYTLGTFWGQSRPTWPTQTVLHATDARTSQRPSVHPNAHGSAPILSTHYVQFVLADRSGEPVIHTLHGSGPEFADLVRGWRITHPRARLVASGPIPLAKTAQGTNV